MWAYFLDLRARFIIKNRPVGLFIPQGAHNLDCSDKIVIPRELRITAVSIFTAQPDGMTGFNRMVIFYPDRPAKVNECAYNTDKRSKSIAKL